jgi:hypothetical protein
MERAVQFNGPTFLCDRLFRQLSLGIADVNERDNNAAEKATATEAAHAGSRFHLAGSRSSCDWRAGSWVRLAVHVRCRAFGGCGYKHGGLFDALNAVRRRV